MWSALDCCVNLLSDKSHAAPALHPVPQRGPGRQIWLTCWTAFNVRSSISSRKGAITDIGAPFIQCIHLVEQAGLLGRVFGVAVSGTQA